MSSTPQRRTGRCLCGSVVFEVTVPTPEFSVCHCEMCRRWSAGPFMAVHCPADATFAETKTLHWYRSSPWAERGFCSRCGTSLFYRLAENPDAMLIVSAEAFDDASDLAISKHIYVDQQPDRYVFGDSAPRFSKEEFLAEFVPPTDVA